MAKIIFANNPGIDLLCEIPSIHLQVDWVNEHLLDI